MQKEGFIYIWYDRKRKMYYVGSHWGMLNDGYICSSKRMRDAYRRRPDDFKRRIVQRNIVRENLLIEEHKWLSQIADNELGEKYYNLSKRHFGHWHIDEHAKKSVKQKLSDASKKLHQDPSFRAKYFEGLKTRPPQTEEAKQKRSNSLKGRPRSEETKRKISEAHKGKICGPLTEETKKKLSEALLGSKNPFYGKQHDPELKKRMNEKTSATMKGRPPNNAKWTKGSFWWNNGSINKRSHVCPGIDWVRGKLKSQCP